MLQEIAAAAVAEEGGASQVAASWGQGSEDVSASWEGGAAASLEGGAGMDGQDVIGQRLVGIGEEEAVAISAEPSKRRTASSIDGSCASTTCVVDMCSGLLGKTRFF